MARARDTGIPGLNAARRAFYAESQNPALVPYTSWGDFFFSLRHKESLVNFIAAYGTHPSITGALQNTTREARMQRRHSSTPPAIHSAVVYQVRTPTTSSTPLGIYANTADGITTTGVDDIDLWVGGLAEEQQAFGGLLGATFNYVFEKQMEDLQDGDRFYYLSRTAGMNLLTQLEGNSFSELIMRNTDVQGLPADSFSRPDLVLNVANLGTTGAILDDPTTPDVNEATVEDLFRTAGGGFRYDGPLHVVFNGRDFFFFTGANDSIISSEGDDTLRGNGGNDKLEGGNGVDSIIGGAGDDILTDLGVLDDTIKGGDGNDVLSTGQGNGGDLPMGGLGHDFIIGGNDITETFGGPGNDTVFAGDAEDTVFGDDGDDWEDGGKGPFNFLNGDNGAPFADDINERGQRRLDPAAAVSRTSTPKAETTSCSCAPASSGPRATSASTG